MSGYPYSQRAAQKPPTQFLEIEVLLTFAKYVGGAVYVLRWHPAVGKLIQATMDTLNAEGSRVRLFGIVDGDIVQVRTARLGGVGFLLLNVSQTITLVLVTQVAGFSSPTSTARTLSTETY